jgi:hypothetical protein
MGLIALRRRVVKLNVYNITSVYYNCNGAICSLLLQWKNVTVVTP